MQSKNQSPRCGRFGKRRVLPLAVWCLFTPCAVIGQAGQSAPDKIADHIARVKSGNFTLVSIEEIAEAHAVQAIPILKEQFALSQDASAKAKLAGALVRLGDKDDAYWNYLVAQAATAAQSDAPPPTAFDVNGKAIPGQLSPEFIAWSRAHSLPPESAAQDVVFGLPVKVAMLAETGDPRGVPLLRQALRSSNYLVAVMAAKGLALIQDKDSIPLIIEACRKAPPDEAMAIADSLIYFDDAQAQTAADRYLPKQYAEAMREARAQGMTPFHR